MALEHILAAIRSEAEAEIDRVEEAAAAEISRIEDEGERRAASEYARQRTSRDGDATRTADRIVNHARLEADREIHAAVERVYQEVLARVTVRLEGLRSSPEYAAVFLQLFDECRSVLPSASVLLIDPRDHALAETVLRSESGRLEIEGSLNSAGGMVLVEGDGRNVDNTIEARMARADPYSRQLTADLVPALGGVV